MLAVTSMMRIWLSREALAAHGLTVADVESALRAENVELPAGRLESSEREFTLRTATGYQREEDFERLVIGRGAEGQRVTLAEVADIRRGAENERSIARSDGVDAVSLAIEQLSRANNVAVSRAVREEIDRIQADLPDGMELAVNYDRAEFIEASMNEVYKALAIALHDGMQEGAGLHVAAVDEEVATPDAELLAAGHCGVQAVAAHRAGQADQLGGRDVVERRLGITRNERNRKHL